jgi:hypothetical protein
MSHFINIALIVWTLGFCMVFFWITARLISNEDWVESCLTAALSLLSLFTALLAVGQYIN